MALTRVGTLTSGTDPTDAQTFDTASVTLTAGRLYVMGIFSQDNSAPEQDPTSVATVGGAVTFAKSVARAFTAARVVSAWYVIPGGSVTAAIRITLNDAGVGCAWTLQEYTGHDATTPIPQSASNQANAASLAATLAALVNSNSHQLAFEAVEGTAADQTISGTDWSEIDNDITPASPAGRFAVAQNVSGTAQQVTFSGGTQDRAMVVVEIAAAASGSAVTMADLPIITIGLAVGSGFAVAIESPAGDSSEPGSRFNRARRQRQWRPYKEKGGPFN